MDTNLVWLLVKPSHLIAYTAVLGIVLWPLGLGRRLRAATAILVVVLGLLPTAWLLIKPLERRFAIPVDLERVDGIIVLAGSERAALSMLYGQPQLNASGDRLTTFLLLAQRFPDAQLVHSGDTAPDSQSEVARTLLLGTGLAPARIVFENDSRNTCESPRAIRARVPVASTDRWLLVTSSYHMPRAVACFRAANWEITPFPADFARGQGPFFFEITDNLADLDHAAHEWAGLSYYRLRGFTDELFPRPR